MISGLISRLYPACAAPGTQGLPIPDPVHLPRWVERNHSHGTLAAPVDFDPAADIPTPAYAVAAPVLFAALLRVGQAQPRCWLAASYPTRLQAHFVMRGARLNFPDMVVAEAQPSAQDGGSMAMLFCASVYGRAGSSAGARRRRLQDFLAALDADLATRREG